MEDRDDIGRLYDVASDTETWMLDNLRERAGFIWVCTGRRGKEHPPWNTQAGEACGQCGKVQSRRRKGAA